MVYCHDASAHTDRLHLLAQFPELKSVSRERILKAGEVLFEQGEDPEFLFHVESGALKVTRSSGSGRDVITELLFPRDVCGALCSLDCRPYPVQATALIDTVVWAIPRDFFLSVCEEKPHLLASATGICRGKMRYQREMMVGMAVEKAEQRAARALLMLADRLAAQDAEGGLSMPMILDRQELSELIGTTVETAIRVISRFRKQGLLSEARGTMRLKQPHLLKEIAGI